MKFTRCSIVASLVCAMQAHGFDWSDFVKKVEDRQSSFSTDKIRVTAVFEKHISSEELQFRRKILQQFHDDPSSVVAKSFSPTARDKNELTAVVTAMLTDANEEPWHETREIVYARDGIRYEKEIKRLVQQRESSPQEVMGGMHFISDGTIQLGIDRARKRATIEAAPASPPDLAQLLESHGFKSFRSVLKDLRESYSGIYLRSLVGSIEILFSNQPVDDTTVIKDPTPSDSRDNSVFAVVRIDPKTLRPESFELRRRRPGGDAEAERTTYHYDNALTEFIPSRIERQQFSLQQIDHPPLQYRETFTLKEYTLGLTLETASVKIPSGFQVNDMLANETYQVGTDIDVLNRIIDDLKQDKKK